MSFFKMLKKVYNGFNYVMTEITSKYLSTKKTDLGACNKIATKKYCIHTVLELHCGNYVVFSVIYPYKPNYAE